MGKGTMPVAERFVSINGEGLSAGCFSTFIRFVGCNLSCSYCDTRWACEAGCSAEELTPEQIVDYVNSTGTSRVTLTGGEPVLQPLLPDLVRLLMQQTVCDVEVETNGAVDLGELSALRRSNECRCRDRIAFTMDCKLPSSGVFDQMLDENFEKLSPLDCVKFVAGSEEDLKVAKRVIEKHGLFDKCEVLFSPVAGKIDPADIVAFLIENDLMESRMQVQLHKIIWPKQDRGV